MPGHLIQTGSKFIKRTLISVTSKSTESEHRRSEVDDGLLITVTPLVQSGRDQSGLIHVILPQVRGDTGLGTLQPLHLRSSVGGGRESIQEGDGRVGGAQRH